MTDCEIDRERIKDRGVHKATEGYYYKATSPSETIALLTVSLAYLHTFLGSGPEGGDALYTFFFL